MRTLWQIAVIIGFYGIGEVLTRLMPFPLPGSVLGLGLILLALQLRWIAPHHLRDGAYGLLGRMLLFFVPAVPAVLDHREFLGLLGVKLLIVILCGTLLVMGMTGAVAQWVAAREDRHD